MLAPAMVLNQFGSILAAQRADNAVSLFDASSPAELRRVGEDRPTGCQWYDLSQADGRLAENQISGVWLPLGAYGVARISAQR